MNNSNDITVHLDKIAGHVWQYKASLMVGSGFSRNAVLATPLIKPAALWLELSLDLAKALYGKQYKKKLTGKTVLQLAEEYNKEFGRNELNNFLKQHIDDENLLPGILHKNMMELPWQDIFTTNYDTLLERTMKEILFTKYDIVYRPEDLPSSQQPRIIKLHGSFGSHYPLIFTEEDYRRYPQTHAPFVNTIQQSLMENILCLIGYSSNDPNFQQWIGWVRDNLQDHTPPIYLIGSLDISSSERKVLENKNIIPINIPNSECISNPHQSAIEYFINYINNHRPKDPLKWDIGRCSITTKDATEEKLKICLSSWKQSRLNYPGWFITPQSIRECLFHDISFFCHEKNIKILAPPDDIQLLFEYNWRLEKALYPILNENIDIYIRILSKYDPFAITHEQEFLISPKTNPELDWQIISEEWLTLNLAVLRWYREEAKHEDFIQLYNILLPLVNKFLHSAHRLYYESVLYHMSYMDIKQIEPEMKKWALLQSDLHWDARRCGILIELGQHDEARHLLKWILAEARKRQPQSKFISDFSMYSLEGELILLSTGLLSFSDKNAQEIKNQYLKRTQELSVYRCDINKEFENFEVCLNIPISSLTTKKQTRVFDKITNTIHWGSLPRDYRDSLCAIRFLEETATFFHVSPEFAVNIASRLKIFSYDWVSNFLVRSTLKKEDYETAFSLSIVASMSYATVNNILQKYIDALTFLSKNESACNSSRNDSNYYTRLMDYLLEITSRLLIKSTEGNAQKFLVLLCEIYHLSIKSCPKRIGIIKVAFQRCYCYCPMVIVNNIDRICSLPIATNTPNDILGEIDLKRYSRKLNSEIKTSTIQVLLDQILSNSQSIKQAAFIRLSCLKEANLLSSSQQDNFQSSLLSLRGTNGFPQINQIYLHAYAKILKDGKKLLKDFFLNHCFSLISDEVTKGHFILNDKEKTLLESANILFSVLDKFEAYYIELSKEELNIFFDKLYTAWNLSKDKIERVYKLLETGFFLSERDGDTIFSSFIELLVNLIIPRHRDLLDQEKARNLVADIIETRITSLRLEFAQSVIDDSKTNWETRFFQNLYSQDMSIFKDAISTIRLMCKYYKLGLFKIDSFQIRNTLIMLIAMRNHETFKEAVNAFLKILNIENLISHQELRPLLLTLKNLLSETSFTNSKASIPQDEKYLFRYMAAKLSYTLYEILSNGKNEVPDVINQWKALADDQEEISTIREIWNNNV